MTNPALKLQEINQHCYCFPIHRQNVEQTISALSSSPAMPDLLADRPNYFANTAVFLSESRYSEILSQINAIEDVIRSPEFQTDIIDRQPNPLFHAQAKTQGAFMGYDFHINEEGAHLIEINSNAGGAFIVNVLEHTTVTKSPEVLGRIYDMFVSEWTLAGRDGKPGTVAIVDEHPIDQFHYPDMLLAADSLRRRGMTVFIVDPSQLSFDGKQVKIGSTSIDLIYNRLTDFGLQAPANKTVYEALLVDAVVVTPAPRHHALYADKRNLVALSNRLSGIPATLFVTPDNQDQLWAQHKHYYFKPYAGFGGRGTYRGAGLTKKVWSEITQGGYIAQKRIAPLLRAVTRDKYRVVLKFDLRVYVYDGEPLLLGARVYEGQTTNLRTEGGGLAPVIVLNDQMTDACYTNLPN